MQGNAKRLFPRGQLIIVSGPAGSGKTTLVGMLMKEFLQIEKSVSYTTRAPRKMEREGKDYHFISKEEFEEKIRLNDFLEYVHIFGHYYGTCRKDVENKLANGKHVILVIDTQGAINLFEKEQTVSIFVSPPSLEELERRLRSRQTETEEKIRERLKKAKEEMSKAFLYDYKIVNDHLSIAYEAVKAIVIAEEHRKEISSN